MEAISASDHSKQRLILAAIKLFAEQGIDGVSLRMINREAGAKNNSALHYHFGSKLGLVEAVVEYIQAWFEEAREKALAAVEAAGEEVAVRDILEAFITPYLQLVENETWGYHAVRFLARMETEGGADIRSILNRFAARTMSRFKKLLLKALPQIPRRLLMQRWNYCVSSIMRGIADYRSLSNSYIGDMSCSLKKLGDLYLDYNAAGLAAPVGQGSGG